MDNEERRRVGKAMKKKNEKQPSGEGPVCRATKGAPSTSPLSPTLCIMPDSEFQIQFFL